MSQTVFSNELSGHPYLDDTFLSPQEPGKLILAHINLLFAQGYKSFTCYLMSCSIVLKHMYSSMVNKKNSLTYFTTYNFQE